MLTIRRSPKTASAHVISVSRRAVSTVIIGSIVMMGLSGCGQKGDLYLADSSSQAVQTSTDMLDSTSHPQDAAFAGINDDNTQKAPDAQTTPDFELPEPSTNPNDY